MTTERSGDGRVVVLFPNYNHGNHLGEMTAAYLGGKRPPDEIVIVDDASTDDSRDIIRALAADDSRIRLIAHEKNGGPNVAIQTGLAAIDSEFIVLSAANDRVTADFLADSVAILEQHPEAGYVFSEPAMFPDDGGPVQTFSQYLSDRPVYLSAEDFEAAQRRAAFFVSTNTMVYRREALIAFGGFDPALGIAADWYAAMGMAYRHGVCFVPKPLAHVRYHDDAYSKQGSSTWPARRAVLKETFAKLDRDAPDIQAAMQRAATIPLFDIRILPTLLFTQAGRKVLSLRLIGRLFTRHVWDYIRPIAPAGLRRAIRARVSGPFTSKIATHPSSGHQRD